MDRWNLLELEAPEGTRSPVVLHSADTGRAVFIALDPGQELGDHQVKETAFVLVVDGVVRIESAGRAESAGSGSLYRFDPDERHSISSESGARLLLFLAPWPGEGHYRGDQRDVA